MSYFLSSLVLHPDNPPFGVMEFLGDEKFFSGLLNSSENSLLESLICSYTQFQIAGSFEWSDFGFVFSISDPFSNYAIFLKFGSDSLKGVSSNFFIKLNRLSSFPMILELKLGWMIFFIAWMSSPSIIESNESL